MSEKRKYKTYAAEFKAEAVDLVLSQGYSVSQAAESVGVSSGLLHKWKTKIESESANKLLSSDERVELAQLRKENKRLKMEKEILKKASAFFAKEMK